VRVTTRFLLSRRDHPLLITARRQPSVSRIAECAIRGPKRLLAMPESLELLKRSRRRAKAQGIPRR
jgi:hypothetical protein